MSELRLLLEPLTTVVGTYPNAAMLLGLVLALFIAYIAALIVHSTLSALMAFAGLYWYLAAVLALALAVWLLTAAIWPEIDCRICRGAGRHRRTFLGRSTSRECRCCGGSGRHTRIGRRALAPLLGARAGT